MVKDGVPVVWLAKIKTKLKTLECPPALLALLVAMLLLGVVTSGLAASYVLPRTIQFSFASSQSCIFSPILLPASLPTRTKDVFALSYMQTLSIGRLTLYAGRLCAAPQQAPKENSAYTSMLALSRISPLRKKIVVRTAPYARITPVAAKSPLALTNSLSFQLSQPDKIFTYVIGVNGHKSDCMQEQRQLVCPLNQLSLQYGRQYSATLTRTFRQGDAPEVAQVSFQTITATTITTATVANGATIYDKPQQFTFQADKPLVSLGPITLSVKKTDGTEQPLATQTSISGSSIMLTVAQPLPRKTKLHLVIASLKAQDASGLAAPYDISFNVSGGPKVTSVTLPKYNATANVVTIRFDQPIDPNQGTSQIAFKANGADVAAHVVISGSTVVITPQSAYPVCAHLALSVGSGVNSTYGISGDSAYTYTARAQCHTSFSIGTSVQGRSITAYKIGSGSTQLLFIGTMHGIEDNAGVLLDKWLNDLEANVDDIPAGRSIVIIPRINPDGVATDTRTNADNVDLNRNFPASDWKSILTEPDGSVGPYGGPSPLSEPESQAIASYVQAQRPRITIDYHSHAGIVQSNGTGDADSLALQYGLTSGYSLLSTSATGTEFSYDTTGSFEDWMSQSPGLPEFLVELYSATNDEFAWNRSAMWNIVRGPLP